MPVMTTTRTEDIVAAWLQGDETAFGADNPAGPLYIGGAAGEAALTDGTEALLTGCSSCTGSWHSYCC